MDKKEIDFICQLHGFAIRVKEIHWNTRDNDEHLLCDEILDGIYELEDRFAECAMGYDGEKFPLKALVPKIPDAQNLTTVMSAFEKAVSEIAHSVVLKPGLVNILDDMQEFANKYKYRATQVG